METVLIGNTMSFEESLKQISPSDKNAKPIKVSLLKQLRKRYYWRLENNQWIVYDKKQNREFTMKVNSSNDALINMLVSSINEPFICLEVRKLHSQKKRLKTKYKSKFTNNLTIFQLWISKEQEGSGENFNYLMVI